MKWQCQKCLKWFNTKDIKDFEAGFDGEFSFSECPVCENNFFLSVKGVKASNKAFENAKDNQLTSPRDNIDHLHGGIKVHIPSDKKYDSCGNCVNQITEF